MDANVIIVCITTVVCLLMVCATVLACMDKAAQRGEGDE